MFAVAKSMTLSRLKTGAMQVATKKVNPALVKLAVRVLHLQERSECTARDVQGGCGLVGGSIHTG